MSATHLLVNVVGEIALLLWGIHMVQTGLARVFGSDLRTLLLRALRTRWRAFLVGAGVTAALQSSTATALIAMSFAGSGVVDLAPAMAVMLGANVGTTLIVQVLSFDIALVFPLFLAAGVLVFRRWGGTRYGQLGRVFIGLGLMLLALQLLSAAVAVDESSALVRDVIGSLTREPLLGIVLAAALAWAAHSSVVVILAVISLASAGLIAPQASLAMVLGANLGSALNPLLEGGSDQAKLRLPVGNMITRLAGTAAVLPFLDPLARWAMRLDDDPGRLVANFHTGFNLMVALAFMGALPTMARLLVRLLPGTGDPADPARPLYLDPAAIRTPPVALANAARETLRVADLIEKMLASTQDTFHTDNRRLLADMSRMDDVVDRLYHALQAYIAAIGRETLTETEALRLNEVQGFAINLEHIGDIIDKNLSELAAKRIRLRLSLSPEGLAEIDVMYRQLLDHLRLAVAVFMSNDVEAARRLVAEKERFRDLERSSTEKHFARVREGHVASIETSGLHLDVVRDLKRIEAHLAATAYPLLERTGVLKRTRLAT